MGFGAWQKCSKYIVDWCQFNIQPPSYRIHLHASHKLKSITLKRIFKSKSVRWAERKKHSFGRTALSSRNSFLVSFLIFLLLFLLKKTFHQTKIFPGKKVCHSSKIVGFFSLSIRKLHGNFEMMVANVVKNRLHIKTPADMT